MEIMEFIFQSFWHWLGTLFLVGVFAGAIGAAIHR